MRGENTLGLFKLRFHFGEAAGPEHGLIAGRRGELERPGEKSAGGQRQHADGPEGDRPE